jgi:hypothetical protein
MASLNTDSENLLNQQRRSNQVGDFLLTDMENSIKNAPSYKKCPGVGSGYIKALVDALIPIYREKYLELAIAYNQASSEPLTSATNVPSK